MAEYGIVWHNLKLPMFGLLDNIAQLERVSTAG